MSSTSARWAAPLFIISLLFAGCSSLIVRDNDSGLEKTGKVVVRAILFLPTFFMSEAGIAQAKQEEQRAIERAHYQDWFQSLSHEDQQRELDRQSYQRGMAMQALGLGLLGGGPIRSHQYQPPFPQQPLTAPAAPLYQAPVSRPPVNCTSNTVGQYTYTNCN